MGCRSIVNAACIKCCKDERTVTNLHGQLPPKMNHIVIVASEVKYLISAN